jgi:galactose mutarotase-like enzyme
MSAVEIGSYDRQELGGNDMAICLKNNEIQVTINEKGAELASMKMIGDDTEYIWTADKAYWARHAPILFPIVGKVVNNQYLVEDTYYPMGQHGFARDWDFQVVYQEEDKVSLTLLWNEESLLIYPYKFKLTVNYTITGNKLRIGYLVENEDDKGLYFSIGAHPGFNCPLTTGELFDDYYFEFSEKETASVYGLTENGFFLHDKTPCLNEESIIPISKALFEKDALVFQEMKSGSVSLKSKKSNYQVKVGFEQFPFLGLWSKPTGAPFVCIEPWFGHADFHDYDGDFAHKADNLFLDVEGRFDCEFSIEILK